jgi:peptide/nickel transport system permease protein
MFRIIRIIRDLYHHDSRFRIGFTMILAVLTLSILSFFSPYDPMTSFKVPSDQPPSERYFFGTNSRGQDMFWMMTFAVRNSLLFGIMTALFSRVISIFVGLLAGYKGGLADRILMSINDSFVIMPVLPLLILLNFILREKMTLVVLSLIMACFGWAWDARLIRSIVLSLKEREFTRTAVYSGMGTLSVMLREHLPFVLPVVFSTTINNMLWSIGMEVTLAVLGLSNINTPTIGTTIFWANEHAALISGVWWWIAAPVVISVILFVGLYLMFTCLNEYLDPRTRLLRIGGTM